MQLSLYDCFRYAKLDALSLKLLPPKQALELPLEGVANVVSEDAVEEGVGGGTAELEDAGEVAGVSIGEVQASGDRLHQLRYAERSQGDEEEGEDDEQAFDDAVVAGFRLVIVSGDAWTPLVFYGRLTDSYAFAAAATLLWGIEYRDLAHDAEVREAHDAGRQNETEEICEDDIEHDAVVRFEPIDGAYALPVVVFNPFAEDRRKAEDQSLKPGAGYHGVHEGCCDDCFVTQRM